jgi:hypothetical protein
MARPTRHPDPLTPKDARPANEGDIRQVAYR